MKMNNYIDYENQPLRETRKEQKIKHQLYDRRTGRIPQEHKVTHRVDKRVWDNVEETLGFYDED